MKIHTYCSYGLASCKSMVSILIMLFLFVGLTAPGNLKASEIPKDDLDSLIEEIIRQHYPLLIKEAVVERMLENGTQYLGRPYKFRNPKGEIMDCSNFVKYLYSMEGINLPRTSSQQADFTISISLAEVQKGDLLFFKGSSLASKRVGHVGMVIEAENGYIKMIHSSNRGVVIDDISMTYYSKRFIKAGRVPELHKNYASLKLIHSE